MPDTTPPSPPLLSLTGITKSYPTCLANDGIDLALRHGEVHALLGENGAGKSTLVKIIYGVLAADTGVIKWQGERIQISAPAAARRLGIAMVFQHFSLFDSLTVLENIALGMDAKVDRKTLEARIVEVSERYGLPLAPRRHVYTLSVGERQRIEIIRCLLQDPQLLVMDEPTSVLTPQEVEKLFETLRRLASEGMAILYISHKLDEIKALCHRATILRGGRRVDCVDVAYQDARSLAAMMMGEELSGDEYGARTDLANRGAVRLQVRELSLPAQDEYGIALKDVCFEVRCGEIFGIAGVAGNGQDELLAALNGEVRCASDNTVRIDDTACGRTGPNERRALGMASIPEERLGHGVVPQMNLVENGLLTAFQRLQLHSSGFIRFDQSRKFTSDVVRTFHVKCGGVQAIAGSLSGGNLQKFIVGREICQQPGLLIVSQPTWGVDAGAAQAIRRTLRELASGGAAVLVISQDLDELMTLSDRIAAICAGRLSLAVPTAQQSVEQVGLMMAGVDVARSAQSVRSAESAGPTVVANNTAHPAHSLPVAQTNPARPNAHNSA